MRRNVWVGAMLLVIALLTPDAAWAHDSGFGLVRYLPDGTLDSSFGDGGIVVLRSARRSFVANTLAMQMDGKVLVGGMNSDTATANIQLAIARYDDSGAPDTTFSADGIVTTSVGDAGAQASAIGVEPDGRVVVAGTAYSHSGPDQFLVARYEPNGVLDPTFGTGGVTMTHVGADAASVAAIALQPDGDIVVVGTAFSNGATDDDFAIARYLASGELDPEFGTGGVVTTDFGSDAGSGNASLDRAGAVALQDDGKIVAAGFTRGNHQAFVAARYNQDGTLDATFGQDGIAQIPASEPQVYAIAAQPSGDLLLAGSSASDTRGTSPFALVRLHANGTPDGNFGSGGVISTSIEGSRSGARAVTVQSDGKLLGGGAKFGAPSATGEALPNSGFALTRYNPDGLIDSSFGKDGRALTSLGDAGATPLALAVQPDGKILAAGLVFFQVVTPPAANSLGERLILVAVLALGAVGVTAAVIAVRRTKSTRLA